MSEDTDPLSQRTDRLRLLTSSEPVFVDLGDGLARLEVWTEARWNALDESQRPSRAEHVPGLGWVVAVPINDLN